MTEQLVDFLEQTIKPGSIIYWTRGGNGSKKPIQCLGRITRITSKGTIFAEIYKSSSYETKGEVKVGRQESILILNSETISMVLLEYMKK